VRAVLALVFSAIATARGARADSTDIIERPLALGSGELRAGLSLEYSLYERMEGDVVSLAPDAWFGVTERWTAGVIHSSQSVDRIGSRASFCLRTNDLLCDRAYQGSGLDVRYRLRDHLVPRMRLLVRDTDPFKPAVTLGALARWTHGRFAITTDPYLRIGLANLHAGNRTAVSLPVWFGVQPTCRWLIEFHTGAEGDLRVLRDGWHMPASIVVTARATAQLDVSVEAGLQQAYGPQIDIKQREVIVTLTLGSTALARAWRGTGAPGSPASPD
jgi:hypothetical protein